MLNAFLEQNIRQTAETIFDGLTRNEFHNLMSSGVTHNYKKGQVIFRELGIPTGIYYLKKGYVKKFKSNGDGLEKILYLAITGELLGYHSVIGEELYSDSATAIEDCDVTFIPKEIFFKSLQDSPDLVFKLLKALGREFNIYKNTIAILATKSVQERVAINLLILDERFRLPSTTEGSIITMSRSDMASIVGTAKETLVRILSEFKRIGLIRITDPDIQIINRLGVVKTANVRELNV